MDVWEHAQELAFMNCYSRLCDDEDSVDVIKQPRLLVTKKKVAVEFDDEYKFGNLKVVQEIGTRYSDELTQECPILTLVSFRLLTLSNPCVQYSSKYIRRVPHEFQLSGSIVKSEFSKGGRATLLQHYH